MSADIFISFASQDGKMARTICTAIESRGFKCWISNRDILAGENFQSSIVRAIRQAKVLLLVFTANSNRSDEMTKELALASQQKLMVVPLRVENVTPSDAFAYEFATRQWIDLFADWEEAMNNLSARLAAAIEDDRTHTDTIVLGKPTLQHPGVAKLLASRKQRTLALSAGAVVLVGTAIGLVISLSGDNAGAQPAATGMSAPAPKTAPAPAIAPVPPAPPAVSAEINESTGDVAVATPTVSVSVTAAEPAANAAATAAAPAPASVSVSVAAPKPNKPKPAPTQQASKKNNLPY